jgi:hypothetical protein
MHAEEAIVYCSIKKEKSMDLYRGKNYGVFTEPNGYYVARIVADGINYCEALSGGEGWSDEVLELCDNQAVELDSMADLLAQ